MILKAHGKKGHRAKFICPISKLASHLSAIIYVDDTDLLHINLKDDESVEMVHQAIQASVLNWGNLLNARQCSPTSKMLLLNHLIQVGQGRVELQGQQRLR